MSYSLWNVESYRLPKGEKFNEWLNANEMKCNSISEIAKLLNSDRHYHFRIRENETYNFFMDVDGYKKSINDFMNVFFAFMYDSYGQNRVKFYYTTNSEKIGSYHVVIPSWNASISKLKEIVNNFQSYAENSKFKADFKYTDTEKKKIRVIDSTIYSEHWFRAPNQYKGDSSKGIHKIEQKEDDILKYFVPNYIEHNSININGIKYINREVKKEEKVEKEKKEPKQEEKKEEKKISNSIRDFKIEVIKRFVKLLSSDYYDYYNEWIKVAMILKKVSKKYEYDFFETFNNFSKQSTKYDKQECKKIYDNLDIDKITINEPSLFKFAKDSNIYEYKLIVKELNNIQKIEVTEKYICDAIYEIIGDYIFYKDNDIYIYNDINHLWINDLTVLKRYICTKIYDYLFNLLNDSITDDDYLKKQLYELKKLCIKNVGQKIICEGYETHYKYYNNKIILNGKFYLFPFTNGVYDFIENTFRQIRFDDYLSMNCGYEYKKPSSDEIDEIEKIFKQIMPKDDELYLLKQIYASGLLGKTQENFIILNGNGRNGKSLLSTFMKTVCGNFYGELKKEYLLDEIKVSNGANVDIADLSYKRFIVASEPGEDKKISNSFIKQITGGGDLQARKCHSNDNKVIIHCTLILECNKKPTLKEEPQDADRDRIIDIPFKSRFTVDDSEVDEVKHIYRCNKDYKNVNFLEKHKHALFYILSQVAHKFIKEEEERFITPPSIKQRTNEYLNLSCSYLQYLKLLCDFTGDNNDFVNIGEIYENFKMTDEYINESKAVKRKFTKVSLFQYYEKNNETSKYFKSVHRYYVDKKQKETTNVLIGYKFKPNENN